MFAGDRPLYSGWVLTLVARTTSEQFRAANRLPMIVSDSPPVWPGTHAVPPSAVSTKLPPPAVYASSAAKELRLVSGPAEDVAAEGEREGLEVGGAELA